MFDNESIVKLLEPYEKIVITGHQKPDGDAIGACFSTAMLLSKIGKKPIVVLEDFIKKYDIIPGKEFLYKGNIEELEPEVFISLDCGSKERFAWLNELFNKAKLTINIDHHMSNNDFSDYNYVDANSVSTCEIVYRLFLDKINIDKKIAEALYAGIIYDSGGLRFRNVSSQTMEIASKLMEFGIDFPNIYNEILLKRTLPEITAIKKAWEKLTLDFNNNLSMTSFTLEDMKELNITRDDLDGIVQMILNIEDINTSVFVYESSPEFFKVSLRSIYLDVNKVASAFGGGGHINAAGCTVSGTLDEVLSKIKAEIVRGLNEKS